MSVFRFPTSRVLAVAAATAMAALTGCGGADATPAKASSASKEVSRLAQQRDLETLEQKAAGADVEMSLLSLQAMGGMGPAAAPRIRPFLNDQRPVVRIRATTALTRAGGRPEGAAIAAMMNDKSPEVRIAAASAAGSLKAPEAVDGLIGAMEADPDERVRAAAARAFHKIGGMQFPYDPKGPPSLRKKQVKLMRNVAGMVKGLADKSQNAPGQE